MGYSLISTDENARVATIQVDGCNTTTQVNIPVGCQSDADRNALYNQVAVDVQTALDPSSPNYNPAIVSGQAVINTPTPLTPLQIMEAKGALYIQFGTSEFNKISDAVWATNQMAAAQGSPLTQQQLLALLNASTTLKETMQSGSLNTSLYLIGQLVAAFPQYAAIGTWATSDIQAFLAANP